MATDGNGNGNGNGNGKRPSSAHSASFVISEAFDPHDPDDAARIEEMARASLDAGDVPFYTRITAINDQGGSGFNVYIHFLGTGTVLAMHTHSLRRSELDTFAQKLAVAYVILLDALHGDPSDPSGPDGPDDPPKIVA